MPELIIEELALKPRDKAREGETFAGACEKQHSLSDKLQLVVARDKLKFVGH